MAHLASVAIETVGGTGDSLDLRTGVEREPAVVQESADAISAGLLIDAGVLHHGDRTGIVGEAAHHQERNNLQ